MHYFRRKMNVNYYTDTLGQSGQRDMTKYTVALFSQLWQRETVATSKPGILTIIDGYYSDYSSMEHYLA